MFKPCDLLLKDKTHSTESDEHIAEHVLPRKPCIILIVAAAMLHHDFVVWSLFLCVWNNI